MYKIEFYEDKKGYSDIAEYIKKLNEKAKRRLRDYLKRDEKNDDMERITNGT